MLFLAKGCFMEQNSRKKTPPNIQFYFQSIITQPIYTFLKLGNGIGLILLNTLKHFYLLTSNQYNLLIFQHFNIISVIPLNKIVGIVLQNKMVFQRYKT